MNGINNNANEAAHPSPIFDYPTWGLAETNSAEKIISIKPISK